MVARVKDRGQDELAQFKARVLRQRALQRIKAEDANWLVSKVEELQRYVSRMDELPDKESEFL